MRHAPPVLQAVHDSMELLNEKLQQAVCNSHVLSSKLALDRQTIADLEHQLLDQQQLAEKKQDECVLLEHELQVRPVVVEPLRSMSIYTVLILTADVCRRHSRSLQCQLWHWKTFIVHDICRCLRLKHHHDVAQPVDHHLTRRQEQPETELHGYRCMATGAPYVVLCR